MKILWYTNIPFGFHLDMLGIADKSAISGSWLYAAYEASKGKADMELIIATVAEVETIKEDEMDGNLFVLIPKPTNKVLHEEYWKTLRTKVNPDVVVIWGTETVYAALAVQVFKGLPIVVFIQGVMNTIYSHYYDGVPSSYRYSTLRDIYNVINQKSVWHSYGRQVGLEKEILLSASAIVSENDWCESVCHCINPNLRTYKIDLPIRNIFYSRRWDIQKAERYSIFTNAGGYPIKGHHILFQALAKVKQHYSQIKCYIPGNTLQSYCSLRDQNGYIKYLSYLIDKYELSDNIEYVGRLSSEQMVDYLTKCRMYVMPSIVENHSSSLIEAMIVGVPCVSSFVGGVGHYAKHADNALLYNSLDCDALAGYIIRLLRDDELAVSLSSNALEIRNSRQQDFGAAMCEMYIKETELK